MCLFPDRSAPSRTTLQARRELLQLRQLLHQMSPQRRKRVRKKRMLSPQEAAAETTRPTLSWGCLHCHPQCHRVRTRSHSSIHGWASQLHGPLSC